MRRAVVVGGVVLAVLVGTLALARRAPEAVTAAAAAPPPTEPVTTVAPTTTTTEPPTTTTTEPPPVAAQHADAPRFPTTVAVAKGKATPIYEAPDGAVRQTLTSPRPYSRMPQVFTVAPGDAPAGWLPVNLSTRPNGSTGWVRAADVELDTHQWSIDINLTARWATVYDGAAVFQATPVVIGLGSSPTPPGDFYVVEGVWTNSPGGAYGPFIYGLSAHSDVYTEFAGGDGQIGLHGTNQPGLMGTAASHGCVRFPNEVIRAMANALPMGVPVHIHV